MNHFPLFVQFGFLIVLIGLAAFFSGSETGLMTLNRYRLQHRARQGDRGARYAQHLLERPDRLIGLILLGNIAVNSLAATIATLIGLQLGGNEGALLATAILTVVLLVFGEVAPKTLAALHPERVALPAAYVYWILRWPMYPLVWAINFCGNGLLRIFGIRGADTARHSLSSEELRSVVAEAGALIPQRHQNMLLSILDLERATVEDIMVPRNEIFGVDISEDWDTVRARLIASQHTRVPVFYGAIDDLRGVVHMRRVVALVSENRLTSDSLLKLAREPYFIPEGTPLNQQLLNFQDQKRRIGFVVDEYGDIQGLVTLEDILEEVVGEFTTDPATRVKNVYLDADGSALVAGSVTIRSLNRSLGWKLPMNGAKTLNGLVVEHLEDIPKAGRSVQISDYQIEITEARDNAIKIARIRPLQMPRRVRPIASGQ